MLDSPWPWVAAAALLVVWFVADLRWLQAWDLRRAEPVRRAQWEEFDLHYRRARGSWRPFARLLRALLLPGALEAGWAMDLHTQGRNGEALPLLDEALRRVRPNLRSTFLAARGTVLTALGRYDEARADFARMRADGPLRPGLAAAEAMLEIYVARPGRALEIAKEALLADPRDDAARVVASSAHALLGHFHAAISVLFYAPSDMTKFYTEAQLDAIRSDGPSLEILEALRREYADVVQPARFLAAAQAYLDWGEPKAAARALDRAEPLFGDNVLVEILYHQNRAVARAGVSDSAGAERHLARARELLVRVPHRRQSRWEVRMAELRSGRPVAEADSFHPIEKLAWRYWSGDRAVPFAAFLSQAAPGHVAGFKPEDSSRESRPG